MKNIFKILLCAALLAVFVRSDFARPRQVDYSVAYINDYEGECELKKKGESIGEAVVDIYVPLYEGDTVSTDDGARMEVVFDDSTIMKLDPNSRLVIKNLKREKEAKTVLELIKGRVFGIVKKLLNKEEFTVRTKLAMAAVKGTELIVETGDEDRVGVYEGAVEVSNMDMSGNVLSKVIVNKDRQAVIVKHMKSLEMPVRLSPNFVRKYREITDLRQKIQYLRELRGEGKTREYKIKRRLDRIKNLRALMQSDPEKYRNLPEGERALVEEMEKEEPYYQAQYDDAKKNDQDERKTRLKKILEERKAKAQSEE
jgi:hypothetical protein